VEIKARDKKTCQSPVRENLWLGGEKQKEERIKIDRFQKVMPSKRVESSAGFCAAGEWRKTKK